MKMNIRHALTGAAFAGLLAAAGQAGAVVYTATYTGTVSSLSATGDAAGFFNGESAGGRFTAVFRWDDADADPIFTMDSPGSNSNYLGPMTGVLSFGGFSVDVESFDGRVDQFDVPGFNVARHAIANPGEFGGHQNLGMQAVGGDDFLASWDWRTTATYDLTGLEATGQASFLHRNSGGETGKAVANLTATSLVVAREGDPISPAPEPAAWALMILGFGAAGAMLRNSRRRGALA